MRRILEDLGRLGLSKPWRPCLKTSDLSRFCPWSVASCNSWPFFTELMQRIQCVLISRYNLSLYLDTIFKYFTTYSEKKLTEPVDKTLVNVWPKECAEVCLTLPTNTLYCRSFDYERSTRTCYIRKIDKNAAGGLTPTFDTQHFDHYERGKS